MSVDVLLNVKVNDDSQCLYFEIWIEPIIQTADLYDNFLIKLSKLF